MAIDKFELPRLDWYDEEGRIYKDAIIDNLNALEAKLQELNELDAFNSNLPDVSTVELEDVTLEDEDNKIVSLKSFLQIFDLINYPMEIQFSGTTLKKLSYWTSSYQYTTITNKETELTDNNKFLVFNFLTHEVRATADLTLEENEGLIACYTDGRVVTLITPFQAKLNLLYLLADMKTESIQRNINPSVVNYYFSDGKQQCAIGHVESKAGSFDNTFLQEGK